VVEVFATGVIVRRASEDEIRALRRMRLGRDFDLGPARSVRVVVPDGATDLSGVYVVGQAFADLVSDGTQDRWLAAEHHGHTLPTERDATTDLLRFANDVAQDGMPELHGDMGFEGLPVSRWDLMRAPHQIQLAADLESLLMLSN
jgi:hypothetical protein